MQTVRGVRFVNAGGFNSSYTPPYFSDVEHHRLHLLQQLQNGRGLDFDVQDYCGLVGQLGPCSIRTDLWLPLPAEGQTFADFARRLGATSQRWMSAVLAVPPVLDSAAAEVILKSVDSFHVEPSGLTLQAFMNQGPKNTQAACAFLREPSLSGFNTVTNIVRVQARAAEQGSSGSRPRRR